MDATNISIKQSSSVSINVDALQTIKQRVLSAVAKFSIFNFPLGSAAFTKAVRRLKEFSIWRVYRKELRLARAVARAVDGHPTLSNIGLLLMGLVLMVEIFLYA